MAKPIASRAPGPLVEAIGLGKRFPGVMALDDVSLALAAGEVAWRSSARTAPASRP